MWLGQFLILSTRWWRHFFSKLIFDMVGFWGKCPIIWFRDWEDRMKGDFLRRWATCHWYSRHPPEGDGFDERMRRMMVNIRAGHAPIFADAHRCASDAHRCAWTASLIKKIALAHVVILRCVWPQWDLRFPSYQCFKKNIFSFATFWRTLNLTALWDMPRFTRDLKRGPIVNFLGQIPK